MTSPTMGGRGPDLEQLARDAAAPHQHVATLTTVATTRLAGPSTPAEAYESRRKRLREEKRQHTADAKTLTLTWREWHTDTEVSITYAAIEPDPQIPGQMALDLEGAS